MKYKQAKSIVSRYEALGRDLCAAREAEREVRSALDLASAVHRSKLAELEAARAALSAATEALAEAEAATYEAGCRVEALEEETRVEPDEVVGIRALLDQREAASAAIEREMSKLPHGEARAVKDKVEADLAGKRKRDYGPKTQRVRIDTMGNKPK